MSLSSGDLTTPARVGIWIPNLQANSPTIQMLITAMSNLILSKLNRARLFSQSFTRTFDGVGNYQLVLPDYPVTGVTKIQMGSQIIQPYVLPTPTTGVIPNNSFGYGYRLVTWNGDLPGDPSILEFVNGFWYYGAQNIQVTYTAGYLISNEAQTIPTVTPFAITVDQPKGIWCRDNGVTFADGTALIAVSGTPLTGQYNPPTDTTIGTYTFSAADTGKAVLISYSFVPADLELACIQMIAESNSYRNRIGEIEKSLGGQETIRYMRGGGGGRQMFPELPPEVEAMIWPYVSVIHPALGAPV